MYNKYLINFNKLYNKFWQITIHVHKYTIYIYNKTIFIDIHVIIIYISYVSNLFWNFQFTFDIFKNWFLEAKNSIANLCVDGWISKISSKEILTIHDINEIVFMSTCDNSNQLRINEHAAG